MATKYSVLRIRFHSRQASKNPSLRTGEKTLSDLLIDALDWLLEGEHLRGKLCNSMREATSCAGRVTLCDLPAPSALCATFADPLTPRFL